MMRKACLIPLIFTLLLIGESHASCDEDRLVKFLAKIQIWSPESILIFSIEELLESDICSKLEQNLKIIGKPYEICQSCSSNNLYVKLITGLHALNDKLCCFESGFYRQYEVYDPCLYELRQDFEICNGPADWIEETDVPESCKISKNIIDCYYIKTAKVCGEPPALMLGDLASVVFQSTMGHSCKNIDKFPIVKDIMPASYIERRSFSEVQRSSVLLILLGSVLNRGIF